MEQNCLKDANADLTDNHLQSSPDADTEKCLPRPADACPQLQDGDEEWIPTDHAFQDHQQLQPPFQDDMPAVSRNDTGGDEDDSALLDLYCKEYDSWMPNTFPDEYTDLGAESRYLYDSSGERIESAVLATDSLLDRLNTLEQVDHPSKQLLTDSNVDCLEGHLLHSEQSLIQQMLSSERNGDVLITSSENDVTSEDQPSKGHLSDGEQSSMQKLCSREQNGPVLENHVTSENQHSKEQSFAEADVSLTDDSLPLEPSMSTAESLSTSLSTSPTSSPLPNLLAGPGHTSATAATGIPLQQGLPGAAPACFVRVHPMHVAAAVAAQHSRVAAVAHQRNLMVAAQQRAALVARQRMAMAAAQRPQAVMMQQHLVRNRYVGAPVVVRPPAFVPVQRMTAPVRVRMSLRRSVLMTEEFSIDRP